MYVACSYVYCPRSYGQKVGSSTEIAHLTLLAQNPHEGRALRLVNIFPWRNSSLTYKLLMCAPHCITVACFNQHLLLKQLSGCENSLFSGNKKHPQVPFWGAAPQPLGSASASGITLSQVQSLFWIFLCWIYLEFVLISDWFRFFLEFVLISGFHAHAHHLCPGKYTEPCLKDEIHFLTPLIGPTPNLALQALIS